MSRAALFVIDIQRALADDAATEIPHAKRVVDAARAILKEKRSNIDYLESRGEYGIWDVVIVQHEETPEKGNLQKGSKEWELVFPQRAQGNEYLVSKDVREYIDLRPLVVQLKDQGDAFESNPTLADELKNRDVGTIIALGIQSECCVLSTCRGALAAGFKVGLLRGAHSTYDSDEKTALDIEREVEEMLESEGVTVVDWKKWLSWNQESQNDLSKRKRQIYGI